MSPEGHFMQNDGAYLKIELARCQVGPWSCGRPTTVNFDYGHFRPWRNMTDNVRIWPCSNIAIRKIAFSKINVLNCLYQKSLTKPVSEPYA